MMNKSYSTLPISLPPFGVNRGQAAQLVGVGTAKFDEMVTDGLMPKAIHIGARRVWNVDAIKQSFRALDGANNDEASEWDT